MQRREETIDPNSFARRHIGPNEEEVRVMLREVGFEDLDSLVEAAVPRNIRLDRDLNLPEAKSEMEALAELRAISRKNKIPRSFIGCGYSDCITPPVIQRNILENPGLVHGLHTLPGGARARSTRGSPQLPDDDHRPDSARDCQCVAA